MGAAAMAIDRLARQHRDSSVPKSEAFLGHLEDYSPRQRQALLIAAENLLSGIEKRHLPSGEKKLVLNAGMRNFREPWARDFGFASYGLLSMKEHQATKENLEVFFHYQKEDGQFPIKVHSTNVLVRTIYSIFNRPQPIKAALRPKYISGHKSLSPDGNALLISAALNYVEHSADQKFLKDYWGQLKQAVHWLESLAPDPDALINQDPFSDWADTIGRSGKVLYTNVVYWKALHDMALAAKKYGFKADHAHFESRAAILTASIQEHFWRPKLGYFITSEEFTNLNTSGNLMAITWGCASSSQSHAILDKMAELGLADPVPTKPVNFPYPRNKIAIEARLGAFPHYHIDAAWLWLGAWHVIALTHMGRLDEASQMLDRLADFIVRDKIVHEVYETNGEHFSNLFYTSEAPLTWSAGMMVYAFRLFHQKLHSQDKEIE
jgi:GH15 family glucan-1,4-alpha-glucosidase